MKGPVQGVAMKAASTPVQKEPAEPGFSARLLPALTLLNSKSPARLKAMAVTSTSSNKMMRGRSEERRGGKECVSTCRSGWSQYHSKKNENYTRSKPTTNQEKR